MTGMLSRLQLKNTDHQPCTRKGMKKIMGFTLIELLIAVAAVGILAAIALPTYTSQMQKVRRTDAKTSLMDLQTRMEHFFTENNTYVGATTPAAVGGTATSGEGYYTLSISNVTATTYTLTAAPAAGSPQAADTTCGTYTLTNTNVKTPNPANCW